MIDFLHAYGDVIAALAQAPFVRVLAFLLVGAIGITEHLERKDR